MKRLYFAFLLIITSLLANAQFFGGFGCADPDAWFDKEIYFYCQNNANNGYYGLNLSGISFVIDGQTQIDIDGTWLYGDYIFLSKDHGFDFSKGSTVALFVNGYYQNTWTCPTSNPTAVDVAKKAWQKKPRVRSGLSTKSILKILRKFKR